MLDNLKPCRSGALELQLLVHALDHFVQSRYHTYPRIKHRVVLKNGDSVFGIDTLDHVLHVLILDNRTSTPS